MAVALRGIQLLTAIAIVLLRSSCAYPATDSPSSPEPQQPIEISDEEVAAHRVRKLEPIVMRLDGIPEEKQAGSLIPIKVVVGPDGSVTSAVAWGINFDDAEVPRKLVAQLKEVIRRAEQEVLALRYRPFERDGRQVTATFMEMVLTIPADNKPVRHVDFPQIHDWKSLRMTLERTACFGTCPSYSIEVRGDGTVIYNGGAYVAVQGRHRDTISQQAVSAILDVFRQADYFSLRDSYRLGATDLPTYKTSIEIDGRSKIVIDYAGLEVGMPIEVEKLEEAFDEIAIRWTKGDASTVHALAAEGWNFKSAEAADTLARIVWYESADAVRDLLGAGVPINGHDEMNRSPLEAAAFRGNVEMLQAILQAGAATDPLGTSVALSRAALAGKLEAVKLLLQHGADADAHRSSSRVPILEPPIVAAAASGVPSVLGEILKYRPDITARGVDGRSALIAAVDAWKRDEDKDVNRLETVRLLLVAGAEVDARDEKGNTALIKNAWNPQTAILLIEHGADINAANKEGWTPLFNASSAELARALLEHGANINVRDKEGKSPLEAAKQYGNPDKVAVLKAAEAGKRK